MTERAAPASPAPRLSAVVIIGPLRNRAERGLAALLGQTAIDDMEIIVVDVAPGAVPLRGAEHPAVRVALRPDVTTFSAAKVEGFRLARADLVAFIEDHALASPAWAEAVLEAFRRPIAVVNFAFACANPETYVSRASLMAEYGPWVAPATAGPVTYAASHNVAYRRSVLEPLLAEFAEPFESEFLIQRRIVADGGVIWLEPRAVVAHENWISMGDALRANAAMKRRVAYLRWVHGRWGLGRRVFYAGGMILSPALHMWRTVRTLPRRPRVIPAYVAYLPVALLLYGAMAVAESLGYLFGSGRSSQSVIDTELAVAREP